MILMATRKKPSNAAKAPPPSRMTYKYLYIPKKQAEELQVFADKKDRSLSYMVKLAVDEYLQKLRKEG